MDEKNLLRFIAKAHKNTYAAPEEIKHRYACKTPILEGHKDFDFSEGDWQYHDSYAGVLWAPGREVIFFKGKPVWCMSYQGKTVDGVKDTLLEEAFSFLKRALRDIDEKMPFRGPANFKEADFEYAFKIEGDYRYFTGRETIKHRGKEIFFQNVMGELIK